MGLRYRVDYEVPIVGGRKPRADIVFTRQRVVVFVDGCFWHGCPSHGGRPKRNSSYWDAKLARNQERDGEQSERLAAAGWTVIRIWEHEDTAAVADRIIRVLRDPA
jgi:DNA mismatch endonuclease (patch repair protein)